MRHMLAELLGLFSLTSVRVIHELYKKGCQEKTSASTGGREDFGLDLQPTVGVSAPDLLRGFALDGLPFPWFSLPVATMPIESKRLRKRD